jgi:hypothetical protein
MPGICHFGRLGAADGGSCFFSPTRQIAPASLKSLSEGPSGEYASIRQDVPLRFSASNRRTKVVVPSARFELPSEILPSVDVNAYTLLLSANMTSMCFMKIVFRDLTDSQVDDPNALLCNFEANRLRHPILKL